MKKLLKILTMVAAVLTTAVIFTTCKQFREDPEEFFSYWSAEVVPTGYDINIAKPYKTDNDGVICVPSSNSLLTNSSVTVTIYLRNPKKFSLVMPSSTSSASDVQKIIRFPGFDADHQPTYSTDNDYTLDQTPDKQALKLTYKSSFLKKHEWGTADIGPEITLKSVDGRPFNKKFSLSLKVNTAPSLEYKGVGKTQVGGKWYHVLIFQAKNMEEAATAGHYVHKDIEKLHIVKQGESAAHYTVSNIDFPNKKINWADSSKFLSGATQLSPGDCEGNPPPLPTGDWLIYFKTDVEVSPSSALKTYEAWLSDGPGLVSNTVQGSTCIRKIGEIQVKENLSNQSGAGSYTSPYLINCVEDGVDLEVWCQTPIDSVKVSYGIKNLETNIESSGEGTASPTTHLQGIKLPAPSAIGSTIKYEVRFKADKPGFASNQKTVYYKLTRKQGAIIDGSKPNAWANLKYAVEHENEPVITIKNEIKAQDSSTTIDGQTIKNDEQINVTRNVKIKAFDANAVINADSKCRIFNVTGGKKLNLENLKLTGGKADGSGEAGYGGAIFARSATVNITGCTLTGNEAKNGGAICAEKTGTTPSSVTVTGGTIGGTTEDKANKAAGSVSDEGRGGAVFIKGATVTLNGCTLEGNKAKNGGGVYMEGGDCTLKALLKNNKTTELASSSGGSIYLKNGTLTMKTGAEISGSNASFLGGGVYISASGGLTSSFTMEGGTISGCNVSSSYVAYGGGVCVEVPSGESGTANFTMQGGSITGCKAVSGGISGSTFGGGVCVKNGATFNMTGGSITGCKAVIDDNTGSPVSQGGGVYIEGSIFNMTGSSSITGCTAESSDSSSSGSPSFQGGGVYVDGSTATSFTMKDSAVITPPSEVPSGMKRLNDVYLSSGAKITVNDPLSPSGGKAALITPDVYGASVQVLDGSIIAGTPQNYKKFKVTPKDGISWYVASTGFLTTVEP